MGDRRIPPPDAASAPKRVFRARFSAGIVIDPKRFAPPPPDDDPDDREPSEPDAPARFWTRRRLFT
jgi:hypothetical protein